jgi:hypothetical protein
MYVTGSDAWNSQKQMSEVRIGGKRRSEVAEGLPEEAWGGNQGGPCFGLETADSGFGKRPPFAYSRRAPIFRS